ncbi:hypothetical protein EC957_004234 [Mortierella hygrophila]|uniref:Mtf2-like C-terminal domain-containing protein n=1 Tax=Mortierella hygrophila TaxID=979708 RepID=A0A9P6FE80_9FUNG|nr:hypothetical protein EC957_004234 [Mortierella hygrophila]
MQRVLPLRSGIIIRSGLQPCQASYQLTRGLATADSGSRPDSDDTVSQEPATATASTLTSSATASPATTTTETKAAVEKEDLVKKFKLKPSAEVGIRAGKREKQRKRDQEEAARKSAEEESRSGADKIHRLFEKLQLGDGDMTNGGSKTTGGASGGAAGLSKSPLGKNVSDSWKFLFDEDDLNEKKTKATTTTTAATAVGAEKKETLDRIPGASDLFPSLSEYRSPTSGKPSAETLAPKGDRWKDPKLKSAEKDAFKALFSSLFEQKATTQDSAPGSKVQSLFSNFNRAGMDSSTENPKAEDSATATLLETLAANTPSTPEIPTSSEDPMQVLNRQLFNLSKRVEPIYLDHKPKTSAFQAMESTVAGQDWMSRDATRPNSKNTLFAAIQDENKVAIRMRNELVAKSGDVIKIKEFVDELIAPYVDTSSSAGSRNEPRPSSISLDGLLAQAILSSSGSSLIGVPVTSIIRPKVEEVQTPPVKARRSLHPFMGHALVEHTRRQGLPVFIRVVRTESYRALLKSRWDTWRDGPGCLEILKEMQRNGALVDRETLSLVRKMQKDINEASVPAPLTGEETTIQQYGWGDEEQAAPLVEMLNMIEGEVGNRQESSNMRHWAKRADSSNMHR